MTLGEIEAKALELGATRLEVLSRDAEGTLFLLWWPTVEVAARLLELCDTIPNAEGNAHRGFVEVYVDGPLDA